MTLVPVALDACPACGGPLAERVDVQGVLRVRVQGSGAAQRTVTVWCPACPWDLVREISSQRPWREE